MCGRPAASRTGAAPTTAASKATGGFDLDAEWFRGSGGGRARPTRAPGGYTGGHKSGMYASAYVVTGADPGDMTRRVDDLSTWYTTNVRWEV